MDVVVAGAGAMGCLYGGLLSLDGHEVLLLDDWQEHVEAINRDGLILERADGVVTAHPAAASTPPQDRGADLVLLFSKSYDTPHWAERAEPLVTADTLLLSLQNGYGNAQVLADRFASDQVLLGVSYQAARILAPGRVLQSASGESVLGPLRPGAHDRGKVVANVLDAAGLPARYEADVHATVWAKLLVNVGVNAVAALTRMSCGELVADPQAWTAIRTLTVEAVAVAEAEGVRLDAEQTVAHIRATLEAAGRDSRPSTLQDIERGRRTEIDALNAAVVRLGEHHGVPTPANGLVTALLTALEARSLSAHA